MLVTNRAMCSFVYPVPGAAAGNRLFVLFALTTYAPTVFSTIGRKRRTFH